MLTKWSGTNIVPSDAAELQPREHDGAVPQCIRPPRPPVREPVHNQVTRDLLSRFHCISNEAGVHTASTRTCAAEAATSQTWHVGLFATYVIKNSTANSE